MIRTADKSDAELLVELIRKSHADVALRFGLTPENCPKHPSNCVTAWIESDFSRVGIGIIAAFTELKTWYKKLGFQEGETKTFAHLPFRVLMMTCRLS